MDHYYFNFADPDAYDDISRWRCHPGDPRFRKLAHGPVPIAYRNGWTYTDRGIWTVCAPDGTTLGRQGWKLHLAVTQSSFDSLLRIARATGYAHVVPFKYLARYEYAWIVNAKYAPRSGSGKGIVFYPGSTEQAVEIARELVSRTRGVPGPRILSDLQLDGTVVHARYGAFVRMHCRTNAGDVTLAMEDESGERVPDPRSVPFSAPTFISVPEAFTRMSAPVSASAGGASGTPPYRIERALHFSNSGGVYLATHSDTGQSVVLKEARPLAGQDLHGGDAVARARHEYTALRKLADLPEFPEVYEQFTWQSHVFTAMEYVPGNTLQEWCAANHPYLLRPDPFRPPSPEEIRTYREKVDHILDQITKAIHAIWERGYIFGDIHSGNVLVTPDLSISLIDLETCVPHDADRPLPGAPGFSHVSKTGRASDEHALRMLELSCYLPITPLVRFDDTKLRQFLTTSRTMFDISSTWADEIERICGQGASAPAPELSPSPGLLNEEAGFADWADRILTGWRSRMTPERSDRLLPNDPTGFALSPVSLATGGSGILWSLLDTDELNDADLVREVTEWTIRRGRSGTERLECGLFDSELGAGCVLRRAGYPDQAKWLVDMALGKDRSGCNSSVFSGTAGALLAAAELASGPDPLLESSHVEQIGAELTERAALILAGLRANENGERRQAYGLMHGLAGIALALHHYGVLVDETMAVAMARELMEFELDAYIRCKDGSLQFNDRGRRTLAYLEEGSCGSALVLAELEAHEGWQSSRASVADLIRAMGPELMVQSGLFRGRSGFLAGLTRLSRLGFGEQTEPLVKRHMSWLGLHELRTGNGQLHFPGAGNFKLSCDLRTGSAGVLVGVAYASGRREEWLPGMF
ncbi:class III lanthionine synthetase LanKC [Nocardiopsis rhodophaea]|uniref:class III lanthionine synthetase LanKC n=1 Tax=Nocardiopsis rhodophaea TaxID=280238 RepID=UPI0031D2CC3C